MFDIELAKTKAATGNQHSISFSSEHLVLGDIVLDCLEQPMLTNDESKTLRDLISEKLNVRQQKSGHDVGLEMHLLDITINATEHVIDEYRLHEAYKADQLFVYWRKIYRDSKKAMQSRRNLSLEDIRNISGECITKLSMKVSEDLQVPFARYLRFRLSHENLVQDLFLGKTPRNIEKNFDPIDARTYVNVALEKKVAALATEIKEPECSGLAKALTQRLEEENVVSFLTNSTLEEKKKFLKNKNQEKEHLDDIFVEKMTAFGDRIQDIQSQIASVPDIKAIDINIVDLTTQVLASAIEAGNFSLIARTLTFAKKDNLKDNLFDLLLREALLASIDDDEKLKNLVAGVYLYDYQTGGLFNSKFLDDVLKRSQSTQVMSDSNYSKLKKKLESLKNNMGNDIHVKLLEHADENALAYMIKEAGQEQYAGQKQWPHNTIDCGKNIRHELERRYVKTRQEIPPTVKKNLQSSWNVAQRGEQLADFYALATKHVCKNFSENKDLYREKAASISNKITAKAKSMQNLTIEAVDLANDWLTPNDNLNLRSSKYFNWSLRSATQHIVAEARSVLKPDFWSRIKRNIACVKHAILGSDLQAAKEVLEKPPVQLKSCLTQEDVNVIPITSQEKNKCLERAVWARARFKRTLDYLTNNSPEKLSILEKHLRLYENGAYAKEQILADHIEKDLIQPSQSWRFWPSRLETIVNKDLRSPSRFYCP